ncbi:STM2901 family protein [Paraburkholderia youngii]|uniref:STM2901 family protein n=1 Tax=Paraburkholderia youngii TaxID=2782701 RepID=UPI003D1E42E0
MFSFYKRENAGSDNRYSFGIHKNIRAVDLFTYVALDETAKQFRISDLTAAAAVLLRQADIPVSGKLAGATVATSVASLAARKVLPFRVAVRLPMITSVGLKGVRIAFTRNLGAFVGRMVPVIGEFFLAADAIQIMRRTVTTYNRLVLPEDRLL